MAARASGVERPPPLPKSNPAAFRPDARAAWGEVTGVLSLGRFLRARFEGISRAQADVLGLDPAPSRGAGPEDLHVRVWRAQESQRETFVRLLDLTPMWWESVPGELRISERYFIASVSRDRTAPRTADLWTFWETAPPFAAAITNFTRLVLSSGYAFPGTYLLHSSAFVLRDGRAVLFFGPSGAGKSTLGSIVVGAGYEPLSDDLNLVETPEDGRAWVQPFPWAGDFGPRRFHGLPSHRLAGIFRLEKGDRNEVRPLQPAHAVCGLAACSPFVNSEPERYGPLLDALGDLVRRVPVFTLRFRKDPGFLPLVEQALR